MFGKNVNQSNIIENFNLFVDAVEKAGIKTNLFKLNEKGSCNGLVYAYKIYSHQGQREEFILSLMFIDSLNDTLKIDEFIKAYAQAERAGKEFIIPQTLTRFLLKKLLMF